MNTESLKKRKYLRARMHDSVLYVSNDFVFRTKSFNISQGGILLEGLSNIPSVRGIPLMIPLKVFPDFSSMANSSVLSLKAEVFPVSIHRVKARIVREMDELTDLGKVLMSLIGCEFVNADAKFKVDIENYVQTYSKNLIYFLNLIQKGGNDPEQVEVIRKIAEVMGYDHTKSLTEIRFKALHDYQSLED